MKPILFNYEMTRAILDGRKTQTRRPIRFPEGMTGRLPPSGERDYLYYPGGIKRPAYQKGDILYVRETWAENTIPHSGNYAGIEYRADYYGGKEPILRWRPSIHMPREAARIFLRVTDVRVERLWGIQPADICAEGVPIGANDSADMAYESFAALWDGTIKPADRDRFGWEANPWVWVYTFERISKEEAEK